MLASEPVVRALARDAEPDGPIDDIQEDILPIVVEEAQELLPSIEALLDQYLKGNGSALGELHRKVHTLKGTVAMAGAMRARALIHAMESWMEQAEEGRSDIARDGARLLALFDAVKERVAALIRGDHRQATVVERPAVDGKKPSAPVVQSPKNVRVSAEDMDRFLEEINEAKLAGSTLNSNVLRVRHVLRDLDGNNQRLANMLRELEMHAETQIASRRSQLQESGEEFDPLEFDRFTRLQEISRSLAEGLNDAIDLNRDLLRQASDQESVLAHQERSIHEAYKGLRQTRLVPVDAINDRLHKVVWQTARELGKSVDFDLEGGRQALDRVLLERIVGPMEHLLRNALAHGIEPLAVRLAANKPAQGRLRVAVHQEAGRVRLTVSDDGAGLNAARIREKAIERGLWPADKPVSDQDAADLVCMPGFSTADAVSEVAGRGVGMDVVRSEVLGMGGRFDLDSRPGQGLTATLTLPTAVASVSAVVVESGGEQWSLPVETIEHMDRADPERLAAARASGRLDIALPGLGSMTVPYADLDVLMGLSAPETALLAASVVVVRAGDRRLAVGATRLSQVADLPLRPLGRWWASTPGIMGAVLLPNGRAGFLIDPLRAPSDRRFHSAPGGAIARRPTVLVVDDSVTMRKVASRFLERQGFVAITAKDGQDAVEILADVVPDAILMDVEMPRMDGFDCVKAVRENAKTAHVPIVMITSRTADKHRQRAMALGANAYMGKPFKEDELLAWLRSVLPPLPA